MGDVIEIVTPPCLVVYSVAMRKTPISLPPSERVSTSCIPFRPPPPSFSLLLLQGFPIPCFSDDVATSWFGLFLFCHDALIDTPRWNDPMETRVHELSGQPNPT